MSVHRFKLFTLTYTIDFPVLFLFLGVLLDIISTSLFVALDAGTEAHIILKELIPISIWFIPVYLFATNAAFVPFLPGVLRKTLSYTIGLSSLLFAMNNFSLVLFRNAFLVDAIGYTPVMITFVLFGLTLFVYLMKKEKLSQKEVVSTCLKLLQFMLFIGVVHSLFVVITWPAFF